MTEGRCDGERSSGAYPLVAVVAGPGRGQGVAVGLLQAAGRGRGHPGEGGLAVSGDVEGGLPAAALGQGLLDDDRVGTGALRGGAEGGGGGGGMVPDAQRQRGSGVREDLRPYLEVEDEVVQLDGVGKVQLDRNWIRVWKNPEEEGISKTGSFASLVQVQLGQCIQNDCIGYVSWLMH